MQLHQRLGSIVAHEGVSGLFQRTLRKLFMNRNSRISLTSKAKEQYDSLVNDFNEKAYNMGYGDLSKYLWYHTIDLGNGLITPGIYDYRRDLPLFKFPTDLKEMNVLDIGSATGFFAFEFEKRGAHVTSVELPSIADWDMPSGEDKEATLKELMVHHQVNTVEELQHVHLDGPFNFCCKVLNSKVKRCHSTIYDLSKQGFGIDAFDLIFVGDVLLHIFSPLKALATLAPLCKDTLIISQILSDDESSQPVMHYVGGDKRGGDSRSWFLPNKICFEQMLKRVGFKSVSIVSQKTRLPKPEIGFFNRAIIHAKK